MWVKVRSLVGFVCEVSCGRFAVVFRVGKGGIYHGKNQVVLTREKLGKRFWWVKLGKT